MTDRVIVYTAEQPIEADILNSNRFPMIGIAKLAEALLGQSTQLYGLGCTPFLGGGMKVTIAPGQIYKYTSVDSTSYGALPADTHQVLKQGLIQDSIDLSTPAPTNPGMSINYLIEMTLQEVDTQLATRDYLAVDSNNVPTGVVYQSTVNGTRQCNCVVTAKAGVQAPTGTQVTPSPDAGYVGAWVVVTNYGDINMSSGAISLYPGAPFISQTIGDFVTKVYADATYATKSGIVSSAYNRFGAVTVTANRYSITNPAIGTLVTGTTLYVSFTSINTGSAALSVNGSPDHTIYSVTSTASIIPLEGGELSAATYRLVFRNDIPGWELSPLNWSQLSNLQNGSGLVIPRPEDVKAYIDSRISGLQIPPGTVWDMPYIKANTPPGWIMLELGSIGNASSGASLRANADCLNLFTVLWDNCANTQCAVSGGRGVSAAADWAANKNIQLPNTSNRARINAASTTHILGSTTGSASINLSSANNGGHAHIPAVITPVGDLGDGNTAYSGGGGAAFGINGIRFPTASSGSGSSVSITPLSTYYYSFMKL